MGVLFPPPDEPLASGLDAFQEGAVVVGKLTTVGALLAVTAGDLCPLATPTPDPPQQDHAPTVTRELTVAGSSGVSRDVTIPISGVEAKITGGSLTASVS